MAEGSLTIASRVECVDDARRHVSKQAAAAGFAQEAVEEVELALTEALANVIEHAYREDPGERIEVWTELEDDTLRVRVRDWGRYFDPAAFRGRDLDDPGEGGYGVFLMAQLMDDVIREPQPDGGTLLTLIKRKDVPDG